MELGTNNVRMMSENPCTQIPQSLLLCYPYSIKGTVVPGTGNPTNRQSPNRRYYAVQSPYQMGTFAPCPFSLSQLVDSRKSLVWRNLSVSERCEFSFPTSRFIRRRCRENHNMKNKSRVQTCPNLGHFSEEQMCPFGTGTEVRNRGREP